MIKAEKIYTGLCILFCTLIIVGNLTYQKFVFLPISRLYSFELSVGAILYPLTFLITDLITEFYSKEKAAFCVRFNIFINLFVVIIITLMDLLPATSWSKIDNATFHRIFGFYGIAFTSSIIACYISQTVDIFLYLWIRKLTNGKYLWIRNNGSTAISLLIDTSIVIGIMSIFDVLPINKFFSLVFTSYLWKFFFTVCSTPLFYFCAWAIRINLPKAIK